MFMVVADLSMAVAVKGTVQRVAPILLVKQVDSAVNIHLALEGPPVTLADCASSTCSSTTKAAVVPVSSLRRH